MITLLQINKTLQAQNHTIIYNVTIKFTFIDIFKKYRILIF